MWSLNSHNITKFTTVFYSFEFLNLIVALSAAVLGLLNESPLYSNVFFIIFICYILPYHVILQTRLRDTSVYGLQLLPSIKTNVTRCFSAVYLLYYSNMHFQMYKHLYLLYFQH